eukprot:CAMPEP_0178387052 /NCGR_PEP_ID=MMETSP0689_2-20121128/8877_1 /TAXON_ID=160604 /ORGANISM="Amphidinium massartii, Strain CS-259" /LENGTH=375 /DNA_ID=CAMNT_0020007409 /DNA_START=229 /DNA_END=1356 /DNA_ORIENTATION=+
MQTPRGFEIDNATARAPAADEGRRLDVGQHHRKHHQEFEDGRLCLRGKLVPNLYLLGAGKCGTAGFSWELREQGVLSVAELTLPAHPTYGNDKEWHWFDHHWSSHPEWDLDEVSKEWYNSLPPCSHEVDPGNKRVVVADFTPTNIRLVPIPNGFTEGAAFEHYDLNKLNLPATLQYLYRGFGHAVNFINLMREPVSQMQSRWYFKSRPKKQKGLKKNGKPRTTWKGSRMGTFEGDITLAMDEFDSGRIHILVWSILYGRHLEAWMSHFPANQFMPIPFRYAAYMKRPQVCDMISKRTGKALQCAAAEYSAKASAHQSEQQGLPPDVHRRVDETLKSEFDLLVRTLYRANQQGAGLVGLTSLASLEDVKQWLITGW